MKNKKVIYTAVFSGYDILKNPKVYTSDWDYVCFTDMDIESECWDVRKVDLHGPHGSRDVKINSHKWLPEYEQWFYLDASISPISHMNFDAVEKDWLGFKHACSDPFEEFHRIVSRGKGDINIMLRQVKDYIDEGVKERQGHMAGGVLFRRNTEKVRALNEAWFAEWRKYQSRDQIGLYKCLHDSEVDWGYLNDFVKPERFDYRLHKFEQPLRVENGMIYSFTPSGIGEDYKDYGTALNAHCAMVPYDEDWIIIRDQDTMYFPTDHRRIIREAVARYPDTGIFGAFTNRIGLQWQLVNDKIDDNPDVMHHYVMAKHLEDKFGSECETIKQPVAGFFMMFRKSTWKSVLFNEGDMGNCDVLFDWAFSCQVKDDLKMPIRLIKGLYLFHFYRFHQEDVRNTEHIFGK